MRSEDDVDVVDYFTVDEFVSRRLVPTGELVERRKDARQNLSRVRVDVEVERAQNGHRLTHQVHGHWVIRLVANVILYRNVDCNFA